MVNYAAKIFSEKYIVMILLSIYYTRSNTIGINE